MHSYTTKTKYSLHFAKNNLRKLHLEFNRLTMKLECKNPLHENKKSLRSFYHQKHVSQKMNVRQS